MTATATKSYTTKETAAELRKTLRATYPETTFSVRSNRGSSYLYVSWTDGPSVNDVETITRTFQTSRSDGMTDSYVPVDNPIDYDCCGVITRRTISDAARERIAAKIKYIDNNREAVIIENGTSYSGRDVHEAIHRYQWHNAL